MRLQLLLTRQQPLGLQRGDAPRSGRSDGLTVLLILDVSRGKDALDGRDGRSGLGDNVAVFVGRDLPPDEGGGGLVTCARAGLEGLEGWEEDVPMA